MNLAIKRLIIIIPIIIVYLVLFQVKNSQITYAADAGNEVCDTLSQASGKDCTDEKSGSAISNGIKTGLNILSIAAGVIAVIMMIIGGIKYITSQGDPSSTSNARNTIIYAIIGIIIVALSQTIVFFVIDSPNKASQTFQQECPTGPPC